MRPLRFSLFSSTGANSILSGLGRVALLACCLVGTAHAAVTGPVAAASAEPIRLALIEGLSGPFANAGEAVFRNLIWAVEWVNARGGVALPGGKRPLELVRFDSKGNTEEALSLLRSAIDRHVSFVMQGNSSATAAALVDALEKHNEREPAQRALLLNYAALEPSLTNERCSFWHFRFDAHADMRLAALTDVLRDDAAVKKVYLIGQDYSFGQYVVKRAGEMLTVKRPDIQIVGSDLHPIGRVKDFAPYIAKIRASGAQVVVTANWGNDLTLLIKAAREAALPVKFYTFYANALGAPAALGDAGIGNVLAVTEWHSNVGGAASEAIYAGFHARFPEPRDDYLHARMQVMVELLAAAIEKARSADPQRVALALEGLRFDPARLNGFHEGLMRAADHQVQQPLVVSVMDRAGAPGVMHDIEGSGYGFRTVRRFESAQVEQPHSCVMRRP